MKHAAVNAFEVAFTLIGVLVAINAGAGTESLLHGLWLKLAAVARRPRRMAGLVFALSLFVCASMSLMRWPLPSMHDEFSYLLQADTFAHWRVTNPTPPLSDHFETFHVLMRPSYQSKYPPAQAIMLAVGQVVTGQPIVGAWLSTALAGVAILWMLYAWLPARWAALGALLFILHPRIVEYWGLTYWGGSVAACGGALVFGALPRLLTGNRARDVFLFGTGAAILANSRPFEGLLVVSMAAVPVTAKMLSRLRTQSVTTLTKVLVPLLAVAVPVGCAMAYYNRRVTGSPLVMPYAVYEEQYATAPFFLWQRPRPAPHYNHKVIADYEVGFEQRVFQENQTAVGFTGSRLAGTWKLVRWFLLAPLAIPAVTLGCVLRDRRMRFAALVCGVEFAGLIVDKWMYPHYFAPVTGLFVVLVIQSMRWMARWKRHGKPVGRMLARTLPIAFASTLVPMAAAWRVPQDSHWSTRRAELARRLTESGNRHLVVVAYGPNHPVHDEWVYNGADVLDAPVVWSRKMSTREDAMLVKRLGNRNVWLLQPDSQQPVLRRYAPVADTTPAQGDSKNGSGVSPRAGPSATGRPLQN